MIQRLRVIGAMGFLLSLVPSGSGPQETARRSNRLAKEASPYLLQHAHNPVDWYPWSDEAFERARKENKPIFLSIGYAACHWCHVMERESFESEETARLLNASFVCIKVDREERPDVDNVYMTAVQVTNGRGGWPLSVFLTPDKKPFFGATYFRPDDFRRILTRIAEVWKSQRGEVEKSADQITDAVRRQMRNVASTARMPRKSVVRDLVSDLRSSFDWAHGGFSKAPKFPPHNALPLLLEAYRRSRDASALKMVTKTLDAMANGGIRDHLGGGFHRYSTDDRWLVPHFEKMLYDNALLARAYAEAYAVTRKAPYARVCRDTLDWMLREMRGPEGGFYSSLDADSEGKEGAYYLWRYDDVVKVLGPTDGARFCRAYGLQPAGNFKVEATGEEARENILHLAAGDSSGAPAWAAPYRAKLLDARKVRVRPGLDDKRLAGWNGLAIGSLARCGAILKEPRYISAAREGASFVLTSLRAKSTLQRRWRPGGNEPARPIPGFLEDYAYVADSLVDLYEATKETRWRDESLKMADRMTALFADSQGGFFDSPAGYETLLVRSKSGYDGALPSPNAVAARVLYRLAMITGRVDLRERADGTVKAFGELAERSPGAVQTLVAVFDRFGDGAAASAPLPAVTKKGPVRIAVALRKSPSGKRVIEVRLTIDPGWHINANRPLDKSLIPTTVHASAEGATFGPARFPAPVRVHLGFSRDELSVYGGSPVIQIPVIAARAASRAEVRVRFQACDDRACLLPQSVTLSVRL